jgi:hypothetical protein
MCKREFFIHTANIIGLNCSNDLIMYTLAYEPRIFLRISLSKQFTRLIWGSLKSRIFSHCNLGC